jgi:hypothetical protein
MPDDPMATMAALMRSGSSNFLKMIPASDMSLFLRTASLKASRLYEGFRSSGRLDMSFSKFEPSSLLVGV